MKNSIVNKSKMICLSVLSMILPQCRDSGKICENFKISKFSENGLIYLERTSKPFSDNYLEGSINLIGWNGDYIVANVTKNYRGDKDGWYVVKIHSGEIKGPMSKTDIDSSLNYPDIKIRNAQDYFK